MFTGLQPAHSPLRRYRDVGISVAAHFALLGIIVFHTAGIIDTGPEWLAHGDSSHTYKLTYFPPDATNNATPPEAAKLMFPVRAAKPHPQSLPQPKPPEPQEIATDADPGDHDSHAGSPFGTMIDGPVVGHEVHVAYPTIYPDPPVARAELPHDLQGDVIIEVTIDSQGNVVETKIVQAIGHGIDEKIEATLRRWHYQPATLDGTPVASRHDVHFHFPS
jgi:TonB family protein